MLYYESEIAANIYRHLHVPVQLPIRTRMLTLMPMRMYYESDRQDRTVCIIWPSSFAVRNSSIYIYIYTYIYIYIYVYSWGHWGRNKWARSAGRPACRPVGRPDGRPVFPASPFAPSPLTCPRYIDLHPKC